MRNTAVSLICVIVFMLVFTYLALDSALSALNDVETMTGAIQVHQLEKIEQLNELQGISE